MRCKGRGNGVVPVESTGVLPGREYDAETKHRYGGDIPPESRVTGNWLHGRFDHRHKKEYEINYGSFMRAG